MSFCNKKCLAISGVLLQIVAVILLSVAFSNPDFFKTHFPVPETGSNFVYPKGPEDGYNYGPDCVSGRIGLQTSYYNPYCAGGMTSSMYEFTGPTTEYYPLFPIRLIQHEYNPLRQFGVAYTGCAETLQNMQDVVTQTVQASITGLFSQLAQVWPQPVGSPSDWAVPNGPSYQTLSAILDQAVAGGLVSEEVAASAKQQAPTMLAGCGAVNPAMSVAQCEQAVLQTSLEPTSQSTFYSYMTTAFNTEITSMEQAVQECEDDNVDYKTLETAKSSWIANLALASAAILFGAATYFLRGYKAVIAGASASLLSLAGAVCVLYAFLELSSTPAADSVGEECEPGFACYESEKNIYLGMGALVLGAVTAILFVVQIVLEVRAGETQSAKTTMKNSNESSSSDDEAPNRSNGKNQVEVDPEESV